MFNQLRDLTQAEAELIDALATVGMGVVLGERTGPMGGFMTAVVATKAVEIVQKNPGVNHTLVDKLDALQVAYEDAKAAKEGTPS